MGELSDYANEGRDYIILNDGESFTGTYTKYSTGIYDRGSGKGKKYISLDIVFFRGVFAFLKLSYVWNFSNHPHSLAVYPLKGIL